MEARARRERLVLLPVLSPVPLLAAAPLPLLIDEALELPAPVLAPVEPEDVPEPAPIAPLPPLDVPPALPGVGSAAPI